MRCRRRRSRPARRAADCSRQPDDRVQIIRTDRVRRADDALFMKRLALAVLFLAGCGPVLFVPVTEEPTPPGAQTPAPEDPVALPPPARKCVESQDPGSYVWECDTVSALEIVSLKVTNADGSAPWSVGQPRVTGLMRNLTGMFLNYPSLQIAASAPSLKPSFGRDSLYGMNACGEAELSMQFTGSIPSGTPVTFTAFPAHINGDACVLARPPVTLTVTAP
jgi:hypothetical protein